MRLQPLGLVLASLVLTSLTTAADASADFTESAERWQLSKRDGHGQHAVAPVLELNETELALSHQPTPPSYYTIDWEDPEQAAARHPGLIIIHGLSMSLAFFVFLPMGELVCEPRYFRYSLPPKVSHCVPLSIPCTE
jgi:hypothetical protein